MLFNSIAFAVLFPVILVLYRAVPFRVQNWPLLRVAFVGSVKPDSRAPFMHAIDEPLYPLATWHVPDSSKVQLTLKRKMSREAVAKGIIGKWLPPKLLDGALRDFPGHLREKNVSVIMHQMPGHPDVFKAMQANPDHANSYSDYLKYVEAPGLEENHFIHTPSVADLGIPVNGLRDHTHLDELGARFCGSPTISIRRTPDQDDHDPVRVH